VRIAVGCDHAGLKLKQFVLKLLAEKGHEYEDFGCNTDESVDYPDYARKVAEAVAGGDFELGILICDTGVGMSIAANKVKGIRAALCCDAFSAGRSRQHNDANVLCISGRNRHEAAQGIVEAFLDGEFEGGRHLRRVDKIKDIEF